MSPAKTAGYSGTPLAKKLGIGTGNRVWLAHAPANYTTLVAPLPDGVVFVAKPSNTTDVAHVFTSKRAELDKKLRSLRKALAPDAAIWVSWPKKASKLTTDRSSMNHEGHKVHERHEASIKLCRVQRAGPGLRCGARIRQRRAGLAL